MQPPVLPAAFCDRLCEIYPATATRDDAEDTLASMVSPKCCGFRINRLRYTGTPEALLTSLRQEGLNPQPLASLPGAYWVGAAERSQLAHSQAAQTAQIYLTNPSSQLAAAVLAVEPGEEVLDLAAAPGGKTLQLAEKMQNQGRIGAVEVVKQRFHRMRANLERHGVTLAECYLQDGRSVGAKCPERFDRVLLDAPCSSEARFRSGEPKSFRHWSDRKIRDCSHKQNGLLRSAFRCLKPGGILVYSTCSFAPEENELCIHRLLRKFPDARLLPVCIELDRFRPGLTQWRGKELHQSLSATRRVIPDRHWDGFFLARITKVAPSQSGR